MSKFDDLFYTLMEEVTTEIVPTSDGEENAEENPEDGTENAETNGEESLPPEEQQEIDADSSIENECCAGIDCGSVMRTSEHLKHLLQQLQQHKFQHVLIVKLGAGIDTRRC